MSTADDVEDAVRTEDTVRTSRDDARDAAAREDAMATHQMASVVIERAAQMMVRATRRGGGRDPRPDPQA